MQNHVLASLLLCFTASPLWAQGDKADKGDKAPKTTVDFQKQIWPILEKNCLDCHSTAHQENGRLKKPKGGLALDSKDGITTGKKGKAIVAGKPDDSLIYQAITLAADDEDRMPPAKKGPPLAKAQTDLIQKWIAEGAEFGKWTGKAKDADDKDPKDKPDDKKNGTDKKPTDKKPPDKPKGKQGPDPLVELQKGLKPLPASTLAAFADGPFRVESIGDGSPLLSVSCAGHTDEVDDRALAALRPLASHITDLDLGRTHVGDDGCAEIAKMPRLTELDLRQTMVGNHGVAALAACTELRTLNLFGTKTGDYAAAALAGLGKLGSIYLWQTEVSASAAVRLREAIPELRLVMAAEMPEPMAEGTGNGRRRGK
ncbi:MAG TPA: c-type cytochrome domain-containing protein [Planctomycetota bacterium]|nr:c-type cytochrome domain-containing protein [Planctomycetota bacterium]